MAGLPSCRVGGSRGRPSLQSVITAGEERPAEMGGAAKLPKMLSEPKEVRFTYMPYLLYGFTGLRDDIGKKIHGNHKKL